MDILIPLTAFLISLIFLMFLLISGIAMNVIVFGVCALFTKNKSLIKIFLKSLIVLIISSGVFYLILNLHSVDENKVYIFHFKDMDMVWEDGQLMIRQPTSNGKGNLEIVQKPTGNDDFQVSVIVQGKNPDPLAVGLGVSVSPNVNKKNLTILVKNKPHRIISSILHESLYRMVVSTPSFCQNVPADLGKKLEADLNDKMKELFHVNKLYRVNYAGVTSCYEGQRLKVIQAH